MTNWPGARFFKRHSIVEYNEALLLLSLSQGIDLLHHPLANPVPDFSNALALLFIGSLHTGRVLKGDVSSFHHTREDRAFVFTIRADGDDIVIQFATLKQLKNTLGFLIVPTLRRGV